MTLNNYKHCFAICKSWLCLSSFLGTLASSVKTHRHFTRERCYCWGRPSSIALNSRWSVTSGQWRPSPLACTEPRGSRRVIPHWW